MLKLKEIYALEGKTCALTDWVMRDEWFPELSNGVSSGPLLDVLQSEGRIQVKELANPYIDGNRVAELHTVHFDGEPVLIVQQAGRSGCDHRKRWVTDAPRYFALLGYVLSKTSSEDSNFEFADPEKLVYPEEVLCFYGHDFAKNFGIDIEAKAPGYQLFPHVENLVPGCDPSRILAQVTAGLTPSSYIRRDECVMQLDVALTREELDSNPRLEATLEGDKNNRYFWYRRCERPQDAPVLKV